MRHKLTALALAGALILGLAAPAVAAEGDLFPAVAAMPAFTDVAENGAPGGPWYDYGSVKICVEAGLMKGVGDGSAFAPGEAITIGEAAVIAARMCAAASGAEIPAGTNWYDGHIALLKSRLQAEGLPDPETRCPALFKDPLSPATREDFVYLLDLGTAPGGELNHITRLPDSRDPVVLRFYNAGVLTGTDRTYGTFDGDKGLTRAEAAAMVARAVRPSLRQALSFQVPQAPLGAEQAAWQKDRPAELKTDAMTTAAGYLSRASALGEGSIRQWFCLDFGVNSGAALLYQEGEGAFTAEWMLPHYCSIIHENLVSICQSEGLTEEGFWNATVTYPKGSGTTYSMADYMKLNIRRVMARIWLASQGKQNITDEEALAARDLFEVSPAFEAIDPRALYEFAAANYPQALYSADEWAALTAE